MKIKAVQNILDKMRDAEDPIQGAVFEKTVEASLEDFCVFMLAVSRNVTMERQTEGGKTVYLFYNPTDHIGSYIPFKKSGCFGGSRVGSKNPMRNPGDPDIMKPFNPDKYDFEVLE